MGNAKIQAIKSWYLHSAAENRSNCQHLGEEEPTINTFTRDGPCQNKQMHISTYYCTAIHSPRFISRLKSFIKDNKKKKIKIVSLRERTLCEHPLLHVLKPGAITETQPLGQLRDPQQCCTWRHNYFKANCFLKPSWNETPFKWEDVDFFSW